jgi:hypothetical protein
MASAKVQAANVSKSEAQEITAEIQAALAGIFAKHNLQARPSRTGFGDLYSYKIEAVTVRTGRNGVNLNSKEAVFFRDMAPYLGLAQSDLGAVFTAAGKQWVLIGGRDSAKFPILAINQQTGATHTLPESEEVVAAIKAVR